MIASAIWHILRAEVPETRGDCASRLSDYRITWLASRGYLPLAANSWTERGVTWNNRLSHQTGLQGDKGVVPGASWMEFDVTNLVTGDDTLTLAVQPTSADGTYVFSREGAVKPQLVLSIEK